MKIIQSLRPILFTGVFSFLATSSNAYEIDLFEFTIEKLATKCSSINTYRFPKDMQGQANVYAIFDRATPLANYVQTSVQLQRDANLFPVLQTLTIYETYLSNQKYLRTRIEISGGQIVLSRNTTNKAKPFIKILTGFLSKLKHTKPTKELEKQICSNAFLLDDESSDTEISFSDLPHSMLRESTIQRLAQITPFGDKAKIALLTDQNSKSRHLLVVEPGHFNENLRVLIITLKQNAWNHVLRKAMHRLN
jgi:hypothetical protein